MYGVYHKVDIKSANTAATKCGTSTMLGNVAASSSGTTRSKVLDKKDGVGTVSTYT